MIKRNATTRCNKLTIITVLSLMLMNLIAIPTSLAKERYARNQNPTGFD